MNRHTLASEIRDYLTKHRDVSHVEARVDAVTGVVRVLFWRHDGSFAGEASRVLQAG